MKKSIVLLVLAGCGGTPDSSPLFEAVAAPQLDAGSVADAAVTQPDSPPEAATPLDSSPALDAPPDAVACEPQVTSCNHNHAQFEHCGQVPDGCGGATDCGACTYGPCGASNLCACQLVPADDSQCVALGAATAYLCQGVNPGQGCKTLHDYGSTVEKCCF